MPRNTLKSFPTARLRRGLAHVHPLCAAAMAPPAEPPDPGQPRFLEVPSPEPIDVKPKAPSNEPLLVAPVA